ncbi:MAG: serine/threonine protein kinase [Oscillospiraceae bacterium]|nr:serine/threonine protein kinase [Oscillospiraceae bacterium]
MAVRVYDFLENGAEITVLENGRLSSYTVLGLAGAGAFSCVYHIEDKNNKCLKYLLKTFNPDMWHYCEGQDNEIVITKCREYAENGIIDEQYKYFEDFSENFKKLIEKEQSCGVTNNNIHSCRFKTADQYPECYIMNDLDGCSLSKYDEEHIKEKDGLLRHIAMTKDMLASIAELREKGVIHFDIKSDNILVNKDGRMVSFIDFGSVYIESKNNYQSFEIQTSRDSANARNLGYCYDVYCAMCIFKKYCKDNHISIADNIVDELDRLTDAGWVQAEFACSKNSLPDKEAAEKYSEVAMSLLNSIFIPTWDMIKQNSEDSNKDCGCSKQFKAEWLKFPYEKRSTDNKFAYGYKCDFYEERKCCINTIAYHYLHDEKIIPVKAELNSEFKNQTEINNYIAECVFGTNVKDAYQVLRDFLEKSRGTTEKRVLVLVNIRNYNAETIKKLMKCLNELCGEKNNYNYNFCYAVFYGTLENIDIYSLLNEKKAEERFITPPENVNEKDIPAFINSRYHYEYFRKLRENKEHTEKISTYQLVTAALASFDHQKMLGFSALMYNKFGENNGSDKNEKRRRISIEEIKKPLTEKDIILIAERTGVITVVERGKSHEYIEVIVSNERMMEDILVDAKMSIVLNSPIEEHIRELSEKPLDESYIASIRERISRDNAYDKAAKFYRPYFLRANFTFWGIPYYYEKNIYLSSNIYGILNNADNNICKEWISKKGWLPKFEKKRYDKKYRDNKNITELSELLGETHKFKKWLVSHVFLIVGVLMLVALLSILGILFYGIYSAEKEAYAINQQEFVNSDTAMQEQYIFKDESIDVKVTDDNKDHISNWFKYVESNGEKHIATITKSTLSEDNSILVKTYIKKYSHAEPMKIKKVIYDNGTKYDAQIGDPYACEVWIMPDSYRITADITQVPAVINAYPGSKGHYMECLVSFSLGENASADTKLVVKPEEELKEYIGLRFENRASNQGIAPVSVTQTDTPNTYKVRFNYDEYTDSIFKDSNEVKTSAYVFVNAEAAHVENSSYPDVEFKALRENRSGDITVVKSSVMTNNEVFELSYHTKSASNSKNYIVFEPDKWKKGYRFYKEGAQFSTKGFNINDNSAHFYAGTLTLTAPEITAGKETVLTLKFSGSNGNGQFFSVEKMEIPFDISQNGKDYSAPNVDVEKVRVTENEDGKYTYKIYLTVTDDFPLSNLDDDWSKYISYSGINVGSQGVESEYPENNDDGTYNTKVIRHIITLSDVEFLKEPTLNADGSIDGVDGYSIFIDAEAFQDGAGNFDKKQTVNLGDRIQLLYPEESEYGIEDDKLYVIYPEEAKIINLTAGHIVSDFGVTTGKSLNEISAFNFSIKELEAEFDSVSELTGKHFAISGGTAIGKNYDFLCSFNCAFGERICVTNAEYRDNRVFFELIFPESTEEIVLNNDMITLYDENGDEIQFETKRMMAHTKENTTRRSYYVEGFNEKVPVKLKIGANVGFVPGADGGSSGEVTIGLIRNVE